MKCTLDATLYERLNLRIYKRQGKKIYSAWILLYYSMCMLYTVKNTVDNLEGKKLHH
jgi:hypothetical protein